MKYLTCLQLMHPTTKGWSENIMFYMRELFLQQKKINSEKKSVLSVAILKQTFHVKKYFFPFFHK